MVMNGLTMDQWWFRSGVLAVVTLWRVYQTIRRPSVTSALITVGILAVAASFVFEALGNSENLEGGRPFLPTSVEVLLLMVGWLALGAYYAHAEASRVAWRIVMFLVGLASVSFLLIAVIGFVIPAGINLYNFTVGEVVLYYLAQLLIYPGLNGAVGYLAYRHTRRSRGALRAALTLTTFSLWLLTPMLVVRFIEVWGRYRGIAVPRFITPMWQGMYFCGATLLFVSFIAVAAAHRTKQLADMWRAVHDNRKLRRLLHDLEAISPAHFAYPQTGWTPLLLKPHTARMTARIECRDRLVTLSPHLGAELTPHDCNEPAAVARAIAMLHRSSERPPETLPTQPIAILTEESPESDSLVKLAENYCRLTER
ncbi:hypothetical protein [Nocardia terpenica]|nr:hypothetical protein [Nocardia terpenica]